MAEESSLKIKLRIPGVEDTQKLTRHEIPGLEPEYFKIDSSRTFLISAARAGEADAPLHEFDPDEVVEIELDDGTRIWTSSSRLCDEVLQLKVSRAAGETIELPAALSLRGPSRGLIGSLIIKTLRFFKIKVSEFAAAKLAAFWENHTLGTKEGRGPGLYQCSTKEKFQLTQLKKLPAALPTDRPALLFLHGTASSTEGSFGKLWLPENGALREKLFAPFQNSVFALEHQTLSKSPIENAMELASALPVGARLNLVSHSRGGLVGELLCRAQMADSRDPFDELDFNVIREDDKAGERGDLKALNRLLKEKHLHVERFVRVACPAWGTTLASERLDVYLSLIFNFLEKIPIFKAGPGQVGYDIFTELIMAIAKERSDPGVFPGIEAMIPRSPLIRLLNRPDIMVDGQLRVIAGDIEGSAPLSALGTLLTDPLFLDDHDLVVNTVAMFGGAERKGGAAFRFYQGADVSHFNYFENQDSAQALQKAITRPEDQTDDFIGFTMSKSDTAEPPYRRDDDRPKPVVFLLPGIMGSHLAMGNNRIWLDLRDLALGGLSRLTIEAQGVRAEAPIWMTYGKLTRFLSATHRTIPFPYDWRLSIETEATRLAEAVMRQLEAAEKHNQPVSIVAHSMGGLVARAMIAGAPEVWERMCRHPEARLIMLGTPNGGSYAIPQVLTGRDGLIKKLAMLDLKNNTEELLGIISAYPGLLEMMPENGSFDLFLSQTWKEIHQSDAENGTWHTPHDKKLEQAKAVRDKLKDALDQLDPSRVRYIAGHAAATPMDLEIRKEGNNQSKLVFLATAHGDGRVPWKTGTLPGVKTWYMPAIHGDLADHEPGFEAILDLLEKGTTDRLPISPPEIRGIPELFELPEEKAPLFPDLEDLARTAVGSKKTFAKEKPVQRTKVSVFHGSLGYASHPVMVGHYKGDMIISAEAYLDRMLDGRLRDLHALGLYPGELNTAHVFLNPRKKPAGAIVIGLGSVGSLSPGSLTQTVSRGVRAHVTSLREQAGEYADDFTGPLKVSISSLLIGTGAGGISVEDCVTAILHGVAHAIQILEDATQHKPVVIEEVQFVELYEDRAIQAVRAFARIRKGPQLARRFEIPENMQVKRLRGGRTRASFFEAPPWWQRLQVTEDSDKRLTFNLLTDRARAEMYIQPTQRQIVDQFIDDAISTTAVKDQTAITLFEMLLPNELKEYAPHREDIVLVLNDGAARYPWELLQERPTGDDAPVASTPEPLAIQSGMIRQLQTVEFRNRAVMGTGKTAFVVGDPPSRFPALPGAASEARETSHILEERGFQVTTLIGKGAGDILKELYIRDYRILHLAGHGVFDYKPDNPERSECCRDVSEAQGISGMVIGDNQFLTPALIHQMRTVPELVFINCCHLGQMGEASAPLPMHPVKLAANLASELINMGVRAVIAAGWAVDDLAAQSFASIFYNKILSGVSFGEAVLSARKEVYREHLHVNTWGAYQCYGDPDFRLFREGPGATLEADKIRFAAPAEAIVELTNITEDATTASESEISHLKKRLETLEDSLPETWLGLAEVRSALGRACGEIDLFEKAVAHYEKVLDIEKAMFPVRAIEQLCNIKARLAVSVAAEDSRRAAKLIEAAAKQLDLLIQTLKPTSERYCLQGSVAKRKAVIMTASDEKIEALKAMANYYQEAIKLEKAHNTITPYPLQNWLTAKVLLGLLGQKPKKPKEFKLLLQKALSNAEKSYLRDPNFWDAIAPVESKLLEHLVAGDLPDHKEKIVSDYLEARKCDGSPREFRSVLEHIDFLRNVSEAIPNPKTRDELRNSLAEIRRGLTA